MSFLDDFNDKQAIQQMSSLLKQSRAQAGPARYTQPSPEAVGQQQPFHSALHAMLYRWFDTDMASDELKSATARQVASGDSAGMIPYLTIWKGEAFAEPQWAALPGLAVSTVQVYHMNGDDNLLDRVYPRLSAYHEWLDRTPEPRFASFMSAESLHINDLIVSTLRAVDLDQLAHIALDMGNKAEAVRWQARADAVLQNLKRDVTTRLEHAEYGVADLIALFSGAASPEQAARLVDSLPRDARYGLAYAAGGDERVSMIVNWLVYVGLRRYGFRQQALALAEQSLRLVEASGCYETYDPLTGEGRGAANCGTAALVMDMIFREKQGKPPRPDCTQEIG